MNEKSRWRGGAGREPFKRGRHFQACSALSAVIATAVVLLRAHFFQSVVLLILDQQYESWILLRHLLNAN